MLQSNRFTERPKKNENNVTPNLTPIKSHFNEEVIDHNKDDQFLRTPSPVTVQQTTITKHVNQPAPGAPPVSSRYYFENNDCIYWRYNFTS